MSTQELIKNFTEIEEQSQDLLGHLKLDEKQSQINYLSEKMSAPDFWSNPENAQTISQQHSKLSEFVVFWQNFNAQISEMKQLIETNTDESEETLKFLNDQTQKLNKDFHKNRLLALMSKKYDDHNAIVSIHAGAGGTDAQDWAEMLMRQTLRYCEIQGLKTEIADISKGSEAGIKSVTFEARGAFAYGYLKSEAGVHRLVRLSPFNPAHTRETSFALIELLPQLEEVEAVELDPKDLEIEATTSSGHGGQSVNTTYSAIRITHKPTGIKVSIQNERSQHQNKELALKILRARVQAVEDQKIAAEKKELRGEFKSAEWGNQIRSYVLHPYKMVKDHRTKFESSDPDKILDGNLEDFAEKYLESLL